MFIAFEGVDGSGKTSIIARVAASLPNTVVVREPGTDPISEQIREIILSKENTSITDETETLLFAAARAQFVSKVIKPYINQNRTILCDRYVYSSYVYQGLAKGLNLTPIKAINSFSTENIMPDITFFIDVSLEEILRRVKCRGDSNRLDCKPEWYYENIIKGYWRLSEDMVVINGNRGLSEIVEEIIEYIKKLD